MTACNSCGALITFKHYGWGAQPLNADGSRHRCRRKRSDELRTHHSKEITGERYTPSCGECAVPPWETCACSARLAA